MASAGAIIKKRSLVSLLLDRAMKSRICSTVITGVCLSSAGVRVRAFGRLSLVLGEITKIAQLVRLAMMGIWEAWSKNIGLFY